VLVLKEEIWVKRTKMHRKSAPPGRTPLYAALNLFGAVSRQSADLIFIG
jgi:hypothetical protein